MEGPEPPRDDGPMRTIATRSGLALPVLGLGTWRMGENPSARAQEVAAIRADLAKGHLLQGEIAQRHGVSESTVSHLANGRRRRGDG